jgi:hypothetical protein
MQPRGCRPSSKRPCELPNKAREKAKETARALLHLRRYRKTATDLVVKHPRFLTAVHINH